GRIVKKIKTSEELGLFVNTALSILMAVGLVLLSYYFIGNFLPTMEKEIKSALIISLSVTLIGVFMMIFRMKALAQVVGLLIMENGIFLAGASIADGVPFFVEMAVSFDVFVAVIILGVFVYRINSLFTHIDTDKLNELKG
ncbi:MAG: NADH-quinone oxidoreductase subunit K, partial [Candidatus Firestonebacteria bacterium]